MPFPTSFYCWAIAVVIHDSRRTVVTDKTFSYLLPSMWSLMASTGDAPRYGGRFVERTWVASDSRRVRVSANSYSMPQRGAIPTRTWAACFFVLVLGFFVSPFPNVLASLVSQARSLLLSQFSNARSSFLRSRTCVDHPPTFECARRTGSCGPSR